MAATVKHRYIWINTVIAFEWNFSRYMIPPKKNVATGKAL